MNVHNDRTSCKLTILMTGCGHTIIIFGKHHCHLKCLNISQGEITNKQTQGYWDHTLRSLFFLLLEAFFFFFF